MGLSSKNRLQIYASKLPTLKNRSTWNELNCIVEGSESTGTIESAKFLLNVWNGDDRFNLRDAMWSWDDQHFEGFYWIINDWRKNGGL